MQRRQRRRPRHSPATDGGVWVVGLDGLTVRQCVEWAVETCGSWLGDVAGLGVANAVGRGVSDVGAGRHDLRRNRTARRGETRRCRGRSNHRRTNDVAVTASGGHGGPAQVPLRRPTSAVLVIGSRGRGGFARLLLGSTSTQCATHASVPTIVIPVMSNRSAPRRSSSGATAHRTRWWRCAGRSTSQGLVDRGRRLGWMPRCSRSAPMRSPFRTPATLLLSASITWSTPLPTKLVPAA